MSQFPLCSTPSTGKIVMTKEPFFRLNQEPEALSGFSRTVAEIEWLLLVLMLFYLVVGHTEESVKIFLLGGLCAFAGFVMAFHYFNFFTQANIWKLVLETWATNSPYYCRKPLQKRQNGWQSASKIHWSQAVSTTEATPSPPISALALPPIHNTAIRLKHCYIMQTKPCMPTSAKVKIKLPHRSRSNESSFKAQQGIAPYPMRNNSLINSSTPPVTIKPKINITNDVVIILRLFNTNLFMAVNPW